jgi:hypothetical protein
MAIDKHEFHFRARHSQCPEQVFNRMEAMERAGKPAFSSGNRQKIIQLFVQSHRDLV